MDLVTGAQLTLQGCLPPPDLSFLYRPAVSLPYLSFGSSLAALSPRVSCTGQSRCLILKLTTPFSKDKHRKYEGRHCPVLCCRRHGRRY